MFAEKIKEQICAEKAWPGSPGIVYKLFEFVSFNKKCINDSHIKFIQIYSRLFYN